MCSTRSPTAARQKLFATASPDLRRKIQIFNGSVQIVNQDLSEAKLLRAVYSDRQLEEVLTDFWYNHFNVFLDKGADRYMVTSYERDVIRPHVLGHFKDLLLATAQSPAMLFYLDNWQSRGVDPKAGGRNRQGLNENYGRELMELHTLGVDGGYTQQDVTEVARCFTGWTIRQPNRGGGFEFNDKIHDKGEKHVLGVTIPAGGGMSDGLKVLDILAHRPSTAHFISKSLAIRFVSDNPPEELIQKMAATFEKTDGDLREVDAHHAARAGILGPGEFPLQDEIAARNGGERGARRQRRCRFCAGPDESAQSAGRAALSQTRTHRLFESRRGLAELGFAAGAHEFRRWRWRRGKIQGVKVDPAQFAVAVDASRIERNILATDAICRRQRRYRRRVSPNSRISGAHGRRSDARFTGFSKKVGQASMAISRRIFLRNSAIAMAGVGSAPLWLERAAFAADQQGARKKVLVAIFQRGAADGLNIVVPHGEQPLLRSAADHRCAATRRQHRFRRRRGRSRWLLRPASLARIAEASVAAAAPRHRACGRLARSHAFALRCAGLHGIGHARSEGDDRWLAESRAASRTGQGFPCARRQPGARAAAFAARRPKRDRRREPEQLHGARHRGLENAGGSCTPAPTIRS